MISNLKLLSQSVATTAVSTVYTVGAITVCRLEGIILTNTANTNVNVKVYAVQSAASAGVANIILNYTLGIGESVPYTPNLNLPVGCTIQVIADTAAVVGITLSGVEMV